MTERKTVVLLILVLVPMASVMGAYTYFWGLGSNGLLGDGSISGTPGPCYNVTIIINYGKDYGHGVVQTFSKLNFTQGATVFEALLSNANVTYYYDGPWVFVTAINGVGNSVASNLYWIYYINGVFGPVASNYFHIGNNSIVEWRYQSSPF